MLLSQRRTLRLLRRARGLGAGACGIRWAARGGAASCSSSRQGSAS